MTSNWKAFNDVPKFETWGELIHYYRTRHPIVVGFVILGTMGTAMIMSNIHKVNDPLFGVKKYKVGYHVFRPDDPKVQMIKTGPIGLDYFGGKYNG